MNFGRSKNSLTQVSHTATLEAGNSVSQDNLSRQRSCRIIFPFIVKGAIKPSGSYKEATNFRASFRVWGTVPLNSNEKQSSLGLHLTPRAMQQDLSDLSVLSEGVRTLRTSFLFETNLWSFSPALSHSFTV